MKFRKRFHVVFFRPLNPENRQHTFDQFLKVRDEKSRTGMQLLSFTYFNRETMNKSKILKAVEVISQLLTIGFLLYDHL